MKFSKRVAMASLISVFSMAIANVFVGAAQAKSPDDVDSIGCGDGTKSVPNSWFVTVSRKDSNIFQDTALLSVNLFSITGVYDASPSSDGTVGIVDVSKIDKLTYDVSFEPGVNSIGDPTARRDTIANRNNVLSQLRNSGATVDCDDIIKAKPLSEEVQSIQSEGVLKKGISICQMRRSRCGFHSKTVKEARACARRFHCRN